MEQNQNQIVITGHFVLVGLCQLLLHAVDEAFTQID